MKLKRSKLFAKVPDHWNKSILLSWYNRYVPKVHTKITPEKMILFYYMRNFIVVEVFLITVRLTPTLMTFLYLSYITNDSNYNASTYHKIHIHTDLQIMTDCTTSLTLWCPVYWCSMHIFRLKIPRIQCSYRIHVLVISSIFKSSYDITA